MADNNGTSTEGVNPVTVKLSKLTEGIGTVFAGVLTMLEALDAETAKNLVSEFSEPDVKASNTGESIKPVREEKDYDPETTKGTVGTVNAVPAEPATAPDIHEQVADVEKKAAVKEPETADTNKPVSTVTADDITKVIVRKIKQDRSNNEKIGSVLKTYGVTKVSELPASKYEAFLTDISQL